METRVETKTEKNGNKKGQNRFALLRDQFRPLTWSSRLSWAEPLRHFSVAAIVRRTAHWADRNSSANRQHRAVRLGHRVIRNPERRMSREILHRFRAHHDQVRVRLARHGDNLFARFAKRGAEYRLAPILRALRRKLFQPMDGGLPLLPYTLLRKRGRFLNHMQHGKPRAVLLRQGESMSRCFLRSMSEVCGKQNTLQLHFACQLAFDVRA